MAQISYPHKFPYWEVMIWLDDESKPDGLDVQCVYFDNEKEATETYEAITVSGAILEVRLEFETEDDSRTLRYKDITGELD